MTGKIIRLPPDSHRETQLLLPWYAAGRLDAADRVRVEAHLADCSRCRAELSLEHRLEAEVADLPLDADLGWAQMRRRISSAGPGGFVGWAQAGAPWVGWGVAASFAAILVWVAAIPRPGTTTYHTLSAAAPAAPSADAVVLFRGDATEGSIERALKASHARIVDGPTGAGAYVLDIPAGQRSSSLAALRNNKDVVMVEPLDGGGPR